MIAARSWCMLLLSGMLISPLHAQVAIVRGRVEVETATKTSAKARRTPIPSTVVWLTPVPGPINGPVPEAPNPVPGMKLVQKNKTFEPRLLVVPAGTTVEFPNRDPFFHNVFSLFEGKRFDLGLYEAGTSRVVHFDRAGISYIFCNIHPEMSAVVITMATPFYAQGDRDGQITIQNVPFGRYQMHVWSEGIGPESPQLAGREITIANGSASLGTILVPSMNRETLAHKNKYGRDYEAPTPDSSVYNQR